MQEEEKMNLEEAFAKLEEIVGELEQEDISLEQSFQTYRAGMERLKRCNQALDQVEKQVLVLNENGEWDEF